MLVMILAGIGFVSCDKSMDEPSALEIITDSEISAIKENAEALLEVENSNTTNLRASTTSPKFCKPTSNYAFKATVRNTSEPIWVKLHNKATEAITYHRMTKSGTTYTCTMRLPDIGWFDYRYAIGQNGSQRDISGPAYVLCNTAVDFSGEVKRLVWPFGADGSSWTNREVIINGRPQKWKSGHWDGGPGYGWESDGLPSTTHSGTAEQYSDDWNRGTGSQDLGAEIRSPLDGYVVIGSPYKGNNYQVKVIQEGPNGQIYQFYVGHVSSNIPVTTNQYVRAGIDIIAYLDKTGTEYPHAHCNLRNITNGARTSLKFDFSAGE